MMQAIKNIFQLICRFLSVSFVAIERLILALKTLHKNHKEFNVPSHGPSSSANQFLPHSDEIAEEKK